MMSITLVLVLAVRSINLNSGAQLLNNTAENYGGGIFLEIDSGSTSKGEKFTINVNDDAVVQGNSAPNGGGIAITQTTGNAEYTDGASRKYHAYVNINGGTIKENSATKNGGAIYINRTKYGTAAYDLQVNISGGEIVSNRADENGGAIYVANDTASTYSKVVVSGGTVKNNTAVNGGAVYLSNGNFEMSGGTISSNSAQNGGGAYVNAGEVTMLGGTMSANTVSGNGGALYVNGGNFKMISGKLLDNTATGSTSYGGGAYVTGGSIEIGASGCTYSDPEGNHENTAHDDKNHPVILGNEAKDSGGGLAVVGSGNITMHCGNVVDNTAPNRGRGLNVYMEKGTFKYLAGDVGKLSEPELVIVGGTFDVGTPFVTLKYYHCNKESHAEAMSALATENRYINMPDGEKYWDAETGYRFFGWTYYGPNDDSAQNFVRAKDDYVALGDPMKVTDEHDSNPDDKIISLYALWAPDQSKVTYPSGAVINGEYTTESWANHSDNRDTYDFVVESNVVTFKAPTKAGYKFVGWYIYQDEGQNANWGYEPVYKPGQSGYAGLDYAKLHYLAAEANGTYGLEMGTTLFGNITMIPAFVPAYTDLTIEKAYPAGANYSIDENQTFVFEISGKPSDDNVKFTTMQVVIKGNGKVTIKDIPVGTYTITEVSGWSWRYSADDESKDITLSNPDKKDYKVSFTNTRTEDKWLSGDSYARNLWTIAGTVVN